MVADDPLPGFGPATRTWFQSTFRAPTPVQASSWRAISRGGHVLVVAPTGSGKTLAAFLWSVDRISTERGEELAPRQCRIVYVSPLKALAADVERNLRRPLAGIAAQAARLGLPAPRITVGVRTGDTPATERRAFARTPPDILITTPESLFLLLTSAARESLRQVDTVIVDEVHAVCGSKRGAHLALSLERLDALLARPAQRIGLSATVRPIEETARFLGGRAPVEVIQPATAKTIEVSVQAPVPDLARPDHPVEDPRRGSIWPAIEARVLDLIMAHRSTIVFANSRRLAERLCTRVNELAADRQPGPGPDGGSAPGVVARTHHGSVSRQQRREVEEDLKAGRLPAVIATSSLELGIDMGAVDLVIQLAAPPSVASGLQRLGRAGHQVGAVSYGVVVPKHRGDLLSCAVVAERMRSAAIEELRYPRNPLDVLAQQIVAMVAMEPLRVDAIAALVRRAAPFAELPDSALRAVLDLLSGRYPSTAFAELRPRLLWDRATDLLTARPGAQRLAVTSGGTIPDRGLFGVFLVDSAIPDEPGRRGARAGRRVGELDEEMVYESRVGDVFLLGSTAWRIEEISTDRVLVSPAPGAPARMPFWKGESAGRPVELGRAIGARLRQLAETALDGLDPQAAGDRLALSGLDQWAAQNLLAYLADQRNATEYLPDDRTMLVERFRDECGDWRLVVHCLLGARVNAPWALAIARRVSDRYRLDGQVVPFDDGVVIRLPDVVDRPPGADLVVFDPDEIAAEVQDAVGTSAMFAARFRECAARALLLPRRDPRRRQPLWQQRQRAAQLLDVARRYPDFPITLEAARECLTDVFDLAGLRDIMRQIAARQIRVIEVTTQRPSPFARSLLLGYVAEFLYNGDAPLAERRATALALDPTLLGELLGPVGQSDLLDRDAITETERRAQWLTPDRRQRSAEDLADLLRLVGDLSEAELVERGARPDWLAELSSAGRAIQVRIAGADRWLAVEDAALVRDALGVALPPGIAPAHRQPVDDPLGELIGRYARSHGPFPAAAVAERFGLPVAVVEQVLDRLATAGAVVRTATGAHAEWCDPQILRGVRRRSLAALRREIEAVRPETLASFLPQWHELTPAPEAGPEAVLTAVERLRGIALPASDLERLILAARVAGYQPSDLDARCASGEVLWAGSGTLPGGDGWITLAFADSAPALLPPPDPTATDRPLAAAILTALDGAQALFFRDLMTRVTATVGAPVPSGELVAALWELVWAGWVSGDTLAPLRARLAGSRSGNRPPARHRSARVTRFGGRGRPIAAPGHPDAAGRWYRLPDREVDPTARAVAAIDAVLDRHGVVTRGAVAAEGIPGGFSAGYRVLSALEERGACRRGYFVEGLGAAQFALPGAVDRLRTATAGPPAGALVLAATDPANPFGAALPWPERSTEHRPSRRAGSLVVLVDGQLALYAERGGRTVLCYTDQPGTLTAAATALADQVASGALGNLIVERADGEPIHRSPLRTALASAGFRETPRGFRS